MTYSFIDLFILYLQALKSELVPFLLRLLEGGLEATENPAATKAQIVKALKAMQRSLQFGEQVCEAQIVKALKAMQRSFQFGEQVCEAQIVKVLKAMQRSIQFGEQVCVATRQSSDCQSSQSHAA